ncbi:hypothetical protein [Sutcliffiella cohnii]|uniref:hypothetical protein n=1 Tax=Sutcliffiella cohnii TaxID=33932 RepID=UPI000831B0B9|nr:hypothetical protein [Sutcliffiella cohnii]
MKKRIVVLSLLILFSLLVVGCSTKSTADGSIQTSIEAIEAFDVLLNNALNDSNSLLSTFNRSLDGLYTGDTSDAQFAKIMKDLVTSSQTLISEVEKTTVDPSVFVYKQNLITHLNLQHDLFLSAVESAIEESIQKDSLRRDYLYLKEEQSEILNAWNNS